MEELIKKFNKFLTEILIFLSFFLLSSCGKKEEYETIVGFPTTKIENIYLEIETGKDVFPEGTEVAITPISEVTEEYASNINTSINDYLSNYTVGNISMKVVDISFISNGKEVQPAGIVSLTFKISEEEVELNANTISILHVNDSEEAEVIASQKIIAGEEQIINVEVDSFSHYVILQSETKYKATLMRDILEGNDRYSIVTFPVTLNDFDAKAYNNAYGSSGLCFTTGSGGSGMNLGAICATQGIVKSTLSSDGYPITAGSDRGEILFSDGSATGKTTHANIDFEFIYDNETGYYTYNSGANHAQYNNSTNTVELYADTIAPFNYSYDVLSLITANSTYATKSSVNSNIKITVNTKTGNNMFRITDSALTDLDSDKYTHLYLRLKSSFTGKLKCRIFYTTSANSDYTDYTFSLTKGVWTDCICGPFDSNEEVTFVRFYISSAVASDYVEIDIAGFLQTENTSPCR